MFTTASQFTLPDLHADCPYKGSMNPHYDDIAKESMKWISGYWNVLSDRKRQSFFQVGSELLCAHVFPYADAEHFRTCCDFVNILFTIDEISDDQDGKDARSTGQAFLRAIRDAEFEDGSAPAKMYKEFRTRLLRHCKPSTFLQFLRYLEKYINAFAVEADLREREEVLDVESYLVLRRENSAVRFCFGLISYNLDFDIPDEVFQDPVFIRLQNAAVDMVCWSNDVYSYNMEQSKGHTGNNIVTVLMKQHNIGIQAASDAVGVHFKTLLDNFIADKARLPSWGPELDKQIAGQVMGMEQWVIGNLNWSFETLRYFGPAHAEVKRTLVVKLYPKEEEED